MKFTVVLATLIALAEVSLSGERPLEIDSAESSFHTQIHDGAGLCLVCYTSVRVISKPKQWDKLEITATIVNVVKGKHKIGESVKFLRKVEGKAGEVSHLVGGLRFVRFDKSEGGNEERCYISFQDPAAVRPVSEVLLRIANEHQKQMQEVVSAGERTTKDFTQDY